MGTLVGDQSSPLLQMLFPTPTHTFSDWCRTCVFVSFFLCYPDTNTFIYIYIWSFFFCYSNSSKRKKKKVHTTDVKVVFEAVRKSMLKQFKKKKKRLAVTLLFLYTRTQLSVLNVVYAMLLTVLFPRLSAPQTERSSSVSKDAPCWRLGARTSLSLCQ